jgi:hypothetical protein
MKFWLRRGNPLLKKISILLRDQNGPSAAPSIRCEGNCPFWHNALTANHRGLFLIGFVYLRRVRWKTMIAIIH